MTDKYLEETPSYVSIGLSPDYSFSIEKKTFDKGFIFFTILISVVLFIVVITMIILSFNLTYFEEIPMEIKVNSKKSLSLHSNYGAVPHTSYKTNKNIDTDDDGSLLSENDCINNSTSIWMNNRCICKPNYYGKTCSQEKYSNKYISAGVINVENIDINPIQTIRTSSKSFSDDSCSNYCDDESSCVGFIYDKENSSCTLLKGNVIVPINDTIYYSNDVESTLYVKNIDSILFQDRIYLAKYYWSFPLRFWLASDSSDFIKIVPNNVTELIFFPSYIKIYNDYTGIYSLTPFSLDDIDIIIKHSNDSHYYIHHSNSILNIPLDWQYKLPIYVVYV